MRFPHLNTGGIHLVGNFSELTSLSTNIARVSCTVYNINGQNIDVYQPKIQRTLIKEGKRADKYGLLFLSSKEIYPRAYKHGGTLLVIKGNTVRKLEANAL